MKYNVLYQKAPMPSQKETVQQAQTAAAAFPSPAGLLVHSHEDKGTSLITRAATAVPPHQLRCIYIFKNLFHTHSSKSSRLDSSLALALQAERMQKKKKKQNKPTQNTTENQKAFQALPFAQVRRLMSFPQLPCPGGTVLHLLAAAQNLKAKPGSKTHQPFSM